MAQQRKDEPTRAPQEEAGPKALRTMLSPTLTTSVQAQGSPSSCFSCFCLGGLLASPVPPNCDEGLKAFCSQLLDTEWYRDG